MKIYLDTSAIGYLDEQASPKEMQDMQSLWHKIQEGKYNAVLSDITLVELGRIKNPDKVKRLMGFLSEILYETISVNDEVERIAELIKRNGLLAADKHQNDRLHIACSVVYACDLLVSLNFKDLVNVKTIRGVRVIASLGGYGNIDIVPPAMLIEGVD